MAWVDNHCSCEAGGPTRAVFAVRDSYFATTDKETTLHRCAACGSLFPEVFPDAASLVEVYGAYYTHAARRRAPRRRALADLTRANYLLRGVPSGPLRLLDYGCGGGDFLERLSRSRPRARLFGTDLRPSQGEGWTWLALDSLEAEAPFDWITLGHVIEHVSDPLALMRRLERLLAPGGTIWIATPNAEAFFFRVLGPLARDVDFPRHREVFSRRGLEALLARAALRARFTPPPRLNAALTAWQSLRLLAGKREIGRGVRLRLAIRLVGRLLVESLAFGAPRLATAPELVAICRRPGAD